MRENCLIEIGCEELPALLVDRLALQLKTLTEQALTQRQVTYTRIDTYATPRRIALFITEIISSTESKTVLKKGPYLAQAYNAAQEPTKAATGFAASCGVEFSELKTITDPKGDRLAYEINEPGKTMQANLLAWLQQDVIQKLQGFKTMRWGKPGVFVRPVQWLTGLIGSEVLQGELFNVLASNYTYGHRFHSQGKLELKHADDYLSCLRANFVEPCVTQRSEIIKTGIAKVEAELKTDLDPELLTEIAQLVEWPVVLVGQFAKEYLRLPKVALKAVLKKHQRCFVMQADNQLAASYIIVSNIISENPASVIQGNNHVIAARLADACFFYDLDCKKSLAEHNLMLKNMTYQASLGSMQDKVERMKAYAAEFAPLLQVESVELLQAAELSKADLACELVNEFPEIQGLFAEHLALKAGIKPAIAKALGSYRLAIAPDALGRAIAIIDQLDHIVEFAKIGLRPTGDKDPYALRRAASIVLNALLAIPNLSLLALLDKMNAQQVKAEVIILITERLNHWCRTNAISLTYLTAVEHLKHEGDISRITEILQLLPKHPDLSNISASFKRLHNLTKNAKIDECILDQLEQAEELALFKANEAFPASSPAEELTALATLNPLVDAMLDNVHINTENAVLKQQRLNLLQKVKSNYLKIADFSKIS